MSLKLLGRAFEGFERAVAAHAEAWPSGRIEATWLGLPQLEASVSSGEVEADLLLIPADWVPMLAHLGRIVPLRGEFEPNGWSASFIEGLTWEGQLYGLPFHDGPQLLFTRPPLEPAATWSAFVDQAQRSGTVLAGAPDGHNNVYDYVLHLWRFGGDLVTDGVLTLDTPQALAALNFLREMALQFGGHDLDSTASGYAFASGNAGTMVNWAGYASLAESDVRCSLVPAHEDGTPVTTVNAFWALCVTATGADPELAWDYVRHSTSAEMDLETTRAGASGTRSSTWTDASVLAEHPEYALFEAAHAHSRPLPRLPYLPALVDVLNELVDAVVWRGEDPQQSLAVAQAVSLQELR